MKKILSVLLSLLFISITAGQEKSKAEFGIKLKGFVKTDAWFDSRQTVAAREGHFFLYPASEAEDPDGNDINAKPNMNILSIQTRITGSISAPDVCGAKTSGVIEGAFFGHSNADVNGFRLRHAFLKLTWENSSLLVGQYWHPMFITEVFPGVVSFNTGVPFQPFSRNPQIKYTKNFDKIVLSFTAASQRDFASTGPAGGSSVYLRNSAMPILDVNAKYLTKTLTAGAGVNFKTLKPRISSRYGYDTDETVSSYAAMGFFKFAGEGFTLKAEGVYGQNLTDLLMLGGYAVKDTGDGTKGIDSYTNVNTFSVWTDISTGKKVVYGLFAGYTENLGADDDVMGAYYARGSNIASVMRISPRIIYNAGKTRYAAELDYTTADYGTADVKGVVKNTVSTANIRVLLAAYLMF